MLSKGSKENNNDDDVDVDDDSDYGKKLPAKGNNKKLPLTTMIMRTTTHIMMPMMVKIQLNE